LSEVLLSRAGIEPDIEIYDEITNYISSEGIDDVMEFLKERAIELGRKIYLIDHHIGVGDFTDVVEIIKDETGIGIKRWLTSMRTRPYPLPHNPTQRLPMSDALHKSRSCALIMKVRSV
jgi:hypothetical protein